MFGFEPLFFGYVGAFALSAVGCFAGLLRVERITDTDVRYGLTTLLLTSGGWAAAHVGYLTAPTPSLQHAFYAVGARCILHTNTNIILPGNFSVVNLRI
jgi:hypothetical protein